MPFNMEGAISVGKILRGRHDLPLREVGSSHLNVRHQHDLAFCMIEFQDFCTSSSQERSSKLSMVSIDLTSFVSSIIQLWTSFAAETTELVHLKIRFKYKSMA